MLITIVCINVISTYNKLRIVLFRHLIHILKHRLLCPVIRIQEIHILSFRHINGCISCTWCSSILLVDHLNASILLRILVTDFTATIRRSVIYDQKLIIRKCLRQYTFNRFTYICFYFIYRHNDADLYITHT